MYLHFFGKYLLWYIKIAESYKNTTNNPSLPFTQSQ